MENPFALNRLGAIMGGKKRFQTGVLPIPKAPLLNTPPSMLPNSYGSEPMPTPLDMPPPPQMSSLIPPQDPTAPLTAPPPPPPTEQATPMSDAETYFRQLEQMRNNKGPALTAYQQAVSAPPKSEDYKPSIWRKLGATAAGTAAGFGSRNPMAGASLAEHIVDSPYRGAKSEYATKLSGLKESAGLESLDMDRQMGNLKDAQAMGLKWSEFQAGEKDKSATRNIAQQNADTASARAKAYIDNFGKKDYQYENQADGSILAINKTNPNDRHIIPANTVAAKTANIASRNADTASRNADIAAGNAKSLANYRTARLGQLANADRATPAELGKAMENALSTMAANPSFSKFIDTKTFPPILAGPPMLGSRDYAQYQAFQKALKTSIETQIGSGKLPLDETDDSDVEIGEPEF